MQPGYVHEGEQAHEDNGDERRGLERGREGQDQQHGRLQGEHIKQGIHRSMIRGFAADNIAGGNRQAINEQDYGNCLLLEAADFMQQRR
ncbi:hypothetical protein D3C81_2082590 [compost metagenome]